MKHLAHGAEWTTQDGFITAYVWVGGRDAYSVAMMLRADGYLAQETAPGDFGAGPEVPNDLVTVMFPVEKFARFVATIEQVREEGQVMVFPTIDDAWHSENAEVKYEDTPWAKAMGHAKNDA